MLAQANPGLAALIDGGIGSGWRLDLSRLKGLLPLAQSSDFRAEFLAVKRSNKERLAAHILASTGITVDPASLFDVQVKRIHEYKRQLLNLMQVVVRYQAMLVDPAGYPPRTVIFAGKAASSYATAKNIIRLIHDVGQVINNDARIGGRLKVVFVPNYGVSVAEIIMPGADLSEQISTAGTEASGTGNMKLALNGALTIGTDDGANIEIRQQVGDDNIFIFGLNAGEVAARRARGYVPNEFIEANADLKRALDLISVGHFSGSRADEACRIVDRLRADGEQFLVCADFATYAAAQDQVDILFRQSDEWSRKSVVNCLSMGSFSSDRSIREYADRIWSVRPVI